MLGQHDNFGVPGDMHGWVEHRGAYRSLGLADRRIDLTDLPAQRARKCRHQLACLVAPAIGATVGVRLGSQANANGRPCDVELGGDAPCDGRGVVLAGAESGGEPLVRQHGEVVVGGNPLQVLLRSKHCSSGRSPSVWRPMPHARFVLVRGAERNPSEAAALPVLVGVDGSPASDAAIGFAFEAAAARKVSLIALHTWSDMVYDRSLRACTTGTAWRPRNACLDPADERRDGQVPGHTRWAARPP